MKNSSRKILSAVSWLTVGQLSADCWPTVGWLLANCRLTVFVMFQAKVLADCRPTLGQHSATCWPPVSNLLVGHKLKWLLTFTHLLLLKLHKKGKSHLKKKPCTVLSVVTMAFAYSFALASKTFPNWFNFSYLPYGKVFLVPNSLNALPPKPF